ncbi:MAG: phage holin family protein, partial [Opitutaceae bacterium]
GQFHRLPFGSAQSQIILDQGDPHVATGKMGVATREVCDFVRRMRRHPLITILLRWAINALGVLAAAAIIPGIDYRDGTSLVIVVVLLSLFNAFLKPLLVLFALPFVVLTLGLGILFINALLFMLAAHFVDGFYVSGFLAAFFGALVVSVLNLVLGSMLGENSVRMRARPPGRPGAAGRRGAGKDDDVIDI